MTATIASTQLKVDAALAELQAALTPPLALREWRTPLTMSSVTAMRRQFLRDRYNRFETPVIFTTTAISEIFEHTDLVPGQGAAKTLNCLAYSLEFDGVERARVTGPFTKSFATLTGAFGNEPDGGYLSELYGWDAAGAKVLLMRCGVYLDRVGQCKNWPYVWRHAGSFAWIHGNASNDVIKMPKAEAQPIPRPLPVRQSFKPVTAAIASSAIARRQLVQGAFENDHDHHYPCVTKSGITVCENKQGYVQDGLFEKHSRWPIVMGERNVCRLPYPLVPRTRRNGQTFVCGNGYIAQLDSTGAAKLMAGHCHKEAVTWQEPPTSVLDPRYIRRGVWDPTIPMESRIFHTPWGGAWVARSLLIDMTAAPVNGEQPHLSYTTADGRLINGPLWLQTDATGCVWAVQFDGKDEDAEPDISYFLPPGTFKDGVGMVTDGNSLFITDRKAHTLEEWNLDTRQKVRDVLAAPLANANAVGYIGAFPRLRFELSAGKTVADARALPICFPEGLDKFVDAAGDVWLHFASCAQQQVRRYNLRTLVMETINIPANSFNRQGVGDYFCTVAVSPIHEGFGPPGTMFVSTYVNAGFGKSMAFLPNGSGWGYFNYQFGGSSYPITQCVGGNRLTTFDADGWIEQFHLFESGIDTPINWAKVQAGFNDWRWSGCSVKYGANAVGSGSTPLPWGVNADRDVYMRDFLGLKP
jgi:hypothetical protein